MEMTDWIHIIYVVYIMCAVKAGNCAAVHVCIVIACSCITEQTPGRVVQHKRICVNHGLFHGVGLFLCGIWKMQQACWLFLWCHITHLLRHCAYDLCDVDRVPCLAADGSICLECHLTRQMGPPRSPPPPLAPSSSTPAAPTRGLCFRRSLLIYSGHAAQSTAMATDELGRHCGCYARKNTKKRTLSVANTSFINRF